MRTEEFEDLKQRTEAVIEKKNRKAIDLQRAIENCDRNLAEQRQAMSKAEAGEDPESYKAAFALVNMYSDRRKRFEQERRETSVLPAIPPQLYAEISAFLQEEGSTCFREEQREILAHLEAIMEIRDRYQAHNLEMRNFASLCENVNQAGYTGPFKPLSVPEMPPAWLEDFPRLTYAFRLR